MEILTQVKDTLVQIRKKSPLVHHITNYVTVTDCANIALAIGASPIMADDFGEVAEIAKISQSLVLNIGTLNERSVLSMLKAAQAANASGIPVIFDPVGAGASTLRNNTASKILEQVKISVLRGNISEINFLAGKNAKVKGVDASGEDIKSSQDAAETAASLARELNCVVAITGETDVISDGEQFVFIKNGHSMLGRVTGTGCMCSSLIGAAGAVSDAFVAAVSGILFMGIAGEIAYEKAGRHGTGSFRAALHDEMSRLDSEVLQKHANVS
ncbi:MAG: hydroxyethylthiazole kinase [Defluviitaleaceae bacterium]|nr:hydroxyethylthiazole kinase [Defluviitaleaceae bacterium]